ncbi:MAG: M20/M25/M40 family metallo-hydrolase [Ruminococcaceae bacterium]|nr:M20/M25/M40 family metallo-hydrolase [Oscillospiraceae bacterium]
MSDLRKNEYAARLSRLIQAETISAHGDTDLSKFYKFHDLLKVEFPSIFAACELEDFSGSILLCWKGKDEKMLPILFMNHHDVVEASGEWTYPAFSGEIADGKVWGRGTLDTKGGLWGMLQAADELAREGFVPARDVYFMSTCCEETTGAGADTISKALLERGIKFAMVLDEGGMIVEEPIGGAKGKYAMIGVGEKGYADLKFTARSNGGHASTPGKNTPLVRLGKFMAAAEKKCVFKTWMSPTVSATLSSLSKSMSGPLKFILGHPKFFSPLLCKVMPSISGAAGAMLRTTLAFTMAKGSDGCNVLPQEAYVIGNMRYSHHQGGKGSIEAITALAKKFDIEVEVIHPGFDSPLSDHNSTAFKLVEKAVGASYTDVLTSPYVMNAASDSRFMSRVCDNCLRFAPFSISAKQLASVHGIDECVDVDTLVPAVDFYRYVITEAHNV